MNLSPFLFRLRLKHVYHICSLHWVGLTILWTSRGFSTVKNPRTKRAYWMNGLIECWIQRKKGDELSWRAVFLIETLNTTWFWTVSLRHIEIRSHTAALDMFLSEGWTNSSCWKSFMMFLTLINSISWRRRDKILMFLACPFHQHYLMKSLVLCILEKKIHKNQESSENMGMST